MERTVEQVYQTLQKLIGLHRQLLENVRAEHQALVNADVKAIQEATFAKQALIEQIQGAESARLKAMVELSQVWKKPLKDLTLGAIAIEIQGRDAKGAEQLRSSLNALTILIKRVSDQNTANRALVDRSLENIHEMKKNVLGEATPKSEVYTQKGQRAPGSGGARLISKEV